VPRQDLDRRVLEAARMLELERWMDRKPGQLSGGQRQRVAMGRAIVRRPAAFLMDEPLSNLDAKLRVQMRSEIARLQRELKTTTVYVTHDQVEALTMGDRVAVLRDGELQQVSAPEDLYAEPDNLFVAAFIGSPAMNLLDGRVSIGASAPVVDFGSQQLELPASVLARRPGLRARDGQAVIVGIRPEDFEDAQISPPAAGTRLQGHVELREALGSELMVHVRTELRPAVAHEARAAAASGDTTAVETIERQARGGEAIVVASFDPRSRVRLGDAVEITVSTDRLYFFDPDTGLAIRES
jgi:multiple sugar transport system ATP-binding protein